MAEMDEFRPNSWTPVEIKEGKYVFSVKVKKCTFRDTDKEKPYMQVVFLVMGGDKDGLEIDTRIYISKAAEWRARYFLKKFDYPADLLEQQPPILRKAKIEGLEGKILVEFALDNFDMLKADVKKFDHINGDDIEKEMAKQAGKQEELPLGSGTDAEPQREIDLNADVAGQAAPTQAAPEPEQAVPVDDDDPYGGRLPEPDLGSLDD
jgi:hypothetical protein